MKIERKCIVTENSEYTKGITRYYLVLFVDEKRGVFECVQVHTGGKYIRNELLRIPSNLISQKYSSCYANVFTGVRFLPMNAVNEIIGKVTDNVYNRIIRGMMLAFMGKYRIDEYVGDNYYYKLIDSPITIDSSMLFDMMFPATMDELEEDPTVEVDPNPIEATPVEIVPVEEPIVEEPEEEITPVEDEEPEDSDVDTEESKDEPVIKIGDKVYSQETIQDIKNEYKKLTENDSRLDYIYDIWSTNGVIPINQIYKIMVSNSIGFTSVRRDSLVLSKDEFAFIMRESNYVIENATFGTYGGSSKKVAYSSISSLKSRCNSLYFGIEIYNKQVNRHKIFTKEEINQIKELIDSGKSKKEIVEIMKIDCSDKSKMTSALHIYNTHTKMQGKIIISKRFDLIKMYKKYDEDKDLRQVVTYMEKNPERIGVIASGIIPEDFGISNHSLAVMVAIYLNKPRNFSYRIAIRLGDYIRNEGHDLYIYLSGKYSAYEHAIINCDKCKDNKRIRQETIYGFLKNSSMDIVPNEDDNIRTYEQKFIALLGIDKRDYIEDRNFVLNNMKKFDKWHNAMIKLRSDDRRKNKGES